MESPAGAEEDLITKEGLEATQYTDLLLMESLASINRLEAAVLFFSSPNAAPSLASLVPPTSLAMISSNESQLLLRSNFLFRVTRDCPFLQLKVNVTEVVGDGAHVGGVLDVLGSDAGKSVSDPEMGVQFYWR